MNIMELLKEQEASIDFDDRWLYWETDSEKWVVRERKQFQRFSKVICRTTDEEIAVKFLREREGIE